jgi:hypothetical protein
MTFSGALGRLVSPPRPLPLYALVVCERRLRCCRWPCRAVYSHGMSEPWEKLNRGGRSVRASYPTPGEPWGTKSGDLRKRSRRDVIVACEPGVGSRARRARQCQRFGVIRESLHKALIPDQRPSCRRHR